MGGGKRWLVPYLRDLWNLHRQSRLVEPFCGALAVALGLHPHRALLNDINPHAVNFYTQAKRGLRITLRMHNDRDYYYRRRTEFNRLIATGDAANARAASLFYYLNRTGYNGLCRFNSKGEFNVPFGRYRYINYRRDFTPYERTFAKWDFIQGDFEDLVLRPDDFVYADPPYDVKFRQYAKDGFPWKEQERLAVWLAGHRGPVVLSNQATPRIERLYRRLGFELIYLRGPRMINCSGDRSPAKEVLAVKNV